MANTYTLISSVTVGAGGASSIDFTSIPATYTDLQLVYSLRTNNDPDGNDYGLAELSINNNSSNLSNRRLLGRGTQVDSFNSTGSTFLLTTGSSVTTNTFSNGMIYFPNYTNSNNKSFSVDLVTENNATRAWSGLYAGLWSNTAAITSIKLTATSSGNFVQYSTAYLYGIKNS